MFELYGEEKHLFLLLSIILLLPFGAHAQIITASFDHSILSKNPSSSTTRNFSQIVVFHSFNHSDSEIVQNRGTSQDTNWNEDIKMNKTGLYFTGHGNITPELYLSNDRAEKSLELNQTNGQSQDSEVSMLNNMANLGIRLTRNLSFGVKYYVPTYEYKEDYSIQYADSQTATYGSLRKHQITGLGAGITYQIFPKWYVGGYYVSINEKVKSDSTYTNSNGDNSSSSFNGKQNLKQYGGGISYLSSHTGKGMRFEIAQSTMVLDSEYDVPDGKEYYGALEFSGRHFTFGLNVKQRKNMYFDNIEILDYVIGDKTFSENYIPSYGAFFSFGSSKGHTFGLSGLMYKISGKRKLFGVDEKANTSLQSFTLNYGYLF
jgi:hypothetical protein